MFEFRSKIKRLHERCASIEEYAINVNSELHKLEKLVKERKEVVTCEVCGCLVEERKAVRGKGEIRTRSERDKHWSWIVESVEYIYRPYYCKVHAPKTEEEENKK
jgi:hypothetical protein